MTIAFSVSLKKADALRTRMAACNLREADLEESFVRSQGPGGQNVNRTATCVYLKHTPSGLDVKMQESRSQPLNRYLARRRLCELLEATLLGKNSPQAQAQQKIRKQKNRRKRRNAQNRPHQPATT